MKCQKCKMDIPNGAKICPYCNSKQGGIGCVGVIVAIVIVGVFISIVANIGKGVRMAQESAASRASASSSSTISEEPYSTYIHRLQERWHKPIGDRKHYAA